MTQMNTVTPTEMLPPPANGNGAGTVPAEVVQAAAAAVDTEAAKKLAALQKIGKLIQGEERKRDKQETVVAAAKSDLEDKREVLSNINATLKELHDELATLAVGKNSERLPFGEAAQSENKPLGDKPTSTPQTDQELQDAFDALSLSAIGVKPRMCDLLEAAGVRNGKELRVWIQDSFRKDIKGIGKVAVDNLSNLLTDKMLEMHEEAKKAKPADAPFDDATIKQDTAERVLNVQNAAFIEIAQRAGGKWAVRFKCRFGKHGVCTSPKADEWIGDHPSRVHAITVATDAVYEFIREMRGKLSGKGKQQSREIVQAIDQLDKKLAEDVQGDGVRQDIKDFWAARPAREAEEAPKAPKRKGRKS